MRVRILHMDCPHCFTEMKSLAELLDHSGLNVKEWPNAYWCEECGTLVVATVGSQQVHIPEMQKLDQT